MPSLKDLLKIAASDGATTSIASLRNLLGSSLDLEFLSVEATEGKNQTLVGAIPFCGEYPGPRFEVKFRSANQIDGISIADGGKMADS